MVQQQQMHFWRMLLIRTISDRETSVVTAICVSTHPASGRKSHLHNILVWEEVALVDYVGYLQRRNKDSSDLQKT